MIVIGLSLVGASPEADDVLALQRHVASQIDRQAVDARAIDELQAHVRLSPNDYRSQGLLGHALLVSGRAQQALSPLNRALSIAPRAAGLHQVAAQAHTQVDRPQEAARLFRTGLRFMPSDAESYYQLAALEQAGERETTRLLRTAVLLAPNHARAYAALALRLQRNAQRPSEREAALRLANMALRLDPSLPSARLAAADGAKAKREAARSAKVDGTSNPAPNRQCADDPSYADSTCSSAQATVEAMADATTSAEEGSTEQGASTEQVVPAQQEATADGEDGMQTRAPAAALDLTPPRPLDGGVACTYEAADLPSDHAQAATHQERAPCVSSDVADGRRCDDHGWRRCDPTADARCCVELAISISRWLPPLYILEAGVHAQTALVRTAVAKAHRLSAGAAVGDGRGEAATHDQTSSSIMSAVGEFPHGCVLWPAAQAVAGVMASLGISHAMALGESPADWSEMSVLEIGSGIGLCSLAALLLGAHRVIATDARREPLALLSASVTRGIARRALPAESALRLTTAELNLLSANATLPPADVVVCADLLYVPEVAQSLARHAVAALRRGDASRVIVGDTHRPARAVFLRALWDEGVRRSAARFMPVDGWHAGTPRHELIAGTQQGGVQLGVLQLTRADLE